MSLTGTIRINTMLESVGALDLSTPTDLLNLPITFTLTSGTGANQANRCWHDARTLGNGANETIDLRAVGGAVDGVGQTLTLTRLVALIIYNTHATTAITVEPGASDGWTSAFAGVEKIKPGGIHVYVAPGAAGYVISNTVKNIKVTNLEAGAGATFDIIIVGSQ